VQESYILKLSLSIIKTWQHKYGNSTTVATETEEGKWHT
jgi:hypothetical protein